MKFILLALGVLSLSTPAVAAPNKAAEWTILVYLNGHNDLDDYGKLNLNQMEAIGSSDQVSVVAQWATLANREHTKRLLIQKDNDRSKITSPVLEDLGKVDMGDARTLKEFFMWGIRNYPAHHYFLVVWDHGSGWHAAVRPQNISWDDLTGSFITTAQLGQVVQDVAQTLGRPVDMYGSDACLMAMAEVAAQMKGAIDQFVGSQDYEPTEGWPYDLMLAELIANPFMTPTQLSTVLAEKYVAFYQDKEAVTFSGLNMNQFAAFETAVTSLAASIGALTPQERARVASQAKATRSFAPDDGDLLDFIHGLQGATDVPISPQLLSATVDATNKLITVTRSTRNYGAAAGISVWLPHTKADFSMYKASYQLLNFDRDTHWSAALDAYVSRGPARL